jgi:quercetin dioxygenase-like cupin family protein
MQPPDITRVFKGVRMEFEVEIVFANEGNQSPEEAHDYEEIIVVTEGVVDLTRGPGTEAETYGKYDCIVLPAGTVHQIAVKEAPVKLVIIHPERG